METGNFFIYLGLGMDGKFNVRDLRRRDKMLQQELHEKVAHWTAGVIPAEDQQTSKKRGTNK